jgi:hypothetical protein
VLLLVGVAVQVGALSNVTDEGCAACCWLGVEDEGVLAGWLAGFDAGSEVGAVVLEVEV